MEPERSRLSPAHHPGRCLSGRFLLGRRLGSGGTGHVYEATQISLRRPVAIKVLLPELVGDRETSEQIKREALIAGRLNHPNIVSVIDCCVDEHVGPYIVMELIEGPTLGELLRSSYRYNPRLCVARMGQILEALARAHAAGVVHADLKPANVMVDATAPSAGVELLKLVDFGTAVMLRRGSEPFRDGVYGTPNYVAPEVIRGEGASVAADIYSAGVVLFELIAGHVPFIGDSVKETLEQHILAPPPSLSTTLPGVWDGPGHNFLAAADQIIMRAMAKDPARRFATAEMLGTAVRGLASFDV